MNHLYVYQTHKFSGPHFQIIEVVLARPIRAKVHCRCEGILTTQGGAYCPLSIGMFNKFYILTDQLIFFLKINYILLFTTSLQDNHKQINN